MNEFLNDFLLPLIPSICFLSLCFKCRNYKKRIEELERENDDLRSKIEWGIHNM